MYIIIVYINIGSEMHIFELRLSKALNDKLNFITPADSFRHSLHQDSRGISRTLSWKVFKF
jgi:hypothetical protein